MVMEVSEVLKVLNLMVIRSLRSWKVLNLIGRDMWNVLIVSFEVEGCW